MDIVMSSLKQKILLCSNSKGHLWIRICQYMKMRNYSYMLWLFLRNKASQKLRYIRKIISTPSLSSAAIIIALRCHTRETQFFRSLLYVFVRL